jgi:hypothetical protein
MNDLKSILSNLEEKEAEASLRPEDCDPKVRAGVEALVRNAKVDVETISKKYRDAVLANTVIVATYGESAEEFASMAGEHGAIPINYNLIQERLVGSLRSKAVGDYYTSTAHFALLDELSKIRLEYEMVQLPTPQANAYSDGIYDAPLAEAVDKLLTKNYGSGLESAVTRREIGKKALEARFSGTKLAVILYNVNKDVDTRFLPAPIASFDIKGKVTDNIVKKKLNELRALIKNTNKLDQEVDQGEQNEQ